jgi:hypothetical protein
MDVNLSNRGLFSFDAAQAKQTLMKAIQHSTNDSNSGAAAASAEKALTLAAAAPSASMAALSLIRQLNLSYNSLHIFTGGEALRGLAVLDLSHNELARLHGHALPSSLVRLNLSHNRLAQLAQLADCTPRLQELDVSHNQLSASALRGLPSSLTQLNVERNEIESLAPFSALLHVVRLNVAHNQLESNDVLQSLRSLHSLRFLDLRGNPISSGTESGLRRQDSGDGSYRDGGSASLGGERTMTQQSLVGILSSVVPRLAQLNGQPLSQAPENRIIRSARRDSGGKQERPPQSSGIRPDEASSQRRSARGGKVIGGTKGDSTHLTNTSRDASVSRPALEVRLMQAKVNELRRLLLAAQDAESKARQERALLTENVKSTARVIDQQGAELERLQDEIAQLREEERLLRVPIATVEESFEQVHASLLATKAKASAAGLQ